MEDASLINGLLSKRQELVILDSKRRERMAVDAVERVPGSLGYQSEAVNKSRVGRIRRLITDVVC